MIDSQSSYLISRVAYHISKKMNKYRVNVQSTKYKASTSIPNEEKYRAGNTPNPIAEAWINRSFHRSTLQKLKDKKDQVLPPSLRYATLPRHFPSIRCHATSTVSPRKSYTHPISILHRAKTKNKNRNKVHTIS